MNIDKLYNELINLEYDRISTYDKNRYKTLVINTDARDIFKVALADALNSQLNEYAAKIGELETKVNIYERVVSNSNFKAIVETPESTPKPAADPKFSYNDLEAMSIYGYPVKDLAILAQRMHSDGLDPLTLCNSNEDYLAGYRRAYEESNKAIEDAFHNMFDDIPKDL